MIPSNERRPPIWWLLPIALAAVIVGLACSSSNANTDAPTSGTAPFACPVTLVSTPFVAPAPYPAQPSQAYHAVWSGSAALWTMLPTDGPRWSGLPENGGKLTQKTFWWSANYAGEAQPAISVSGRRLDAAGEFASGNPGTNATADVGTAMLVGIELPSKGCWEIRAKYRGAELGYVVLVE